MKPILPRKKSDPTSQKPNRDRAIRKTRSIMKGSAAKIRALIDRIPYSVKDVDKDNAPTVEKSQRRGSDLKTNARYYEWQIDQALMDQTIDAIRAILVNDLLSGSNRWAQRWWFNAHLDFAYEQGTTQSLMSAQRITRGITLEQTTQATMSTLTAEAVLSYPAYNRRLGLIHGRVFNEMEGIVGETAKELRRVLTDAMGRGVGIKDLKQMINSRVGVGMARAERIARTEVNQAFRQAYMDESDELNEILSDDEFSIRQMHYSALAPTTRESHANRHGKVYTAEQQADWWSRDANSISCLCSTIDVLVNDKTGEVVEQGMVDQLKEEGKEYFRGQGITK